MSVELPQKEQYVVVEPVQTKEYVIDDKTRARLDNDFVHHPPKEKEVGDRYAQIRSTLKCSAFFICAKTPPSREQSLQRASQRHGRWNGD